jgi:hypothetical protein
MGNKAGGEATDNKVQWKAKNKKGKINARRWETRS